MEKLPYGVGEWYQPPPQPQQTVAIGLSRGYFNYNEEKEFLKIE